MNISTNIKKLKGFLATKWDIFYFEKAFTFLQKLSYILHIFLCVSLNPCHFNLKVLIIYIRCCNCIFFLHWDFFTIIFPWILYYRHKGCVQSTTFTFSTSFSISSSLTESKSSLDSFMYYSDICKQIFSSVMTLNYG